MECYPSFNGVCGDGDSEGGGIPLANDVNCLNDVRMWWWYGRGG